MTEPDFDDEDFDQDAWEASFTTGRGARFRFLKAVLVFPGPLPGKVEPARSLLAAGAELLRAELAPGVPARWETLSAPAGGRGRSVKRLDPSGVPDTGTVRFSFWAQVPGGTGVPSGRFGTVAFASVGPADIGDGVRREAGYPLSQGMLVAGWVWSRAP